MEKYSHSKLDIARECKLKFKYQYITKPEGKENRDAADFGEVCHYIAEKYTGGGKEELLALYHTLVPSKIILVPEYKARVPLALKNIHHHHIACLKHVENPGKEIEITVNLLPDVDLTGKLDLLITTDKKMVVKDYKTNKARKSHNNQLSMYMLMLHLKYKIPYNQIDTEIVYLALNEFDKRGNPVLNEGIDNIIDSISIDETDVECLKSEIITIHNSVQKSKDNGIWKANPGKFRCTYCKYSHLCPDKFTE